MLSAQVSTSILSQLDKIDLAFLPKMPQGCRNKNVLLD